MDSSTLNLLYYSQMHVTWLPESGKWTRELPTESLPRGLRHRLIIHYLVESPASFTRETDYDEMQVKSDHDLSKLSEPSVRLSRLWRLSCLAVIHVLAENPKYTVVRL